MGEFDGVPGIATFGGQGGKSDGMGTEGVTESGDIILEHLHRLIVFCTTRKGTFLMSVDTGRPKK